MQPEASVPNRTKFELVASVKHTYLEQTCVTEVSRPRVRQSCGSCVVPSLCVDALETSKSLYNYHTSGGERALDYGFARVDSTYAI